MDIFLSLCVAYVSLFILMFILKAKLISLKNMYSAINCIDKLSRLRQL